MDLLQKIEGCFNTPKVINAIYYIISMKEKKKLEQGGKSLEVP